MLDFKSLFPLIKPNSLHQSSKYYVIGVHTIFNKYTLFLMWKFFKQNKLITTKVK